MPDTPKSNPPITPSPGKPVKAELMAKPIARRTKHKLDVFVLLHSLKRRWWQATLLGILLATLVGIGVWFIIPLANPLVYARVQIHERMGGIWQGHPDPPLQRQTQIALIKDPVTLMAVLRRPDVAQLSIVKEQAEPEEWLMRELRIEFPAGPELMQFSLYGDRPQELKVIVSAVREVFLQNYGDRTLRDRQNRLKNLQDYNRETKATIDNLYEQLRKKAEAGKDVDKETIALKHKLNMELLESTNKDITKTRSALRQVRTDLQIAMSETGATSTIPAKMVEEALLKHPLVLPLVTRYVDVEELLIKTRQAAPSNPRVAVLQKELDEIQKQIEAKKLEVQANVQKELKSKYQLNREALIAALKERIRQLEETEKAQFADSVRLKTQSEELNTTIIQLEEERQQITVLEAVRARLAGAIEQLKAEKDAPERIERLNDPVISSIDKYSNKIRFSAMGAMAAFMLGLFLVSYLESRTRRINSPDDVWDHFGLNVVGKVPAPPKRMGLSFAAKPDDPAWQHLLTESVDSFRTQLLFKARANSHQILMISSADSGEGKTSLACHLALSLARSGLKTLLIDADLRNPTIHVLFEMPLEPGLSEAIREVIPIEDALHRTPAAGLWMIPSGVSSRRVIELLAQDRLEHLFSKLRQQFDFIIVDTSPILPVADPLLIAQHTDGVIFSLMHQVSRHSAVRDAVEKLSSLNIQTLGAVINGTQPDRGYHNRKYAYRTMQAQAES